MAGVASVTATIDAAAKTLNGVIELLLWMQPAKPWLLQARCIQIRTTPVNYALDFMRPMSVRLSSRTQRFEPVGYSGDCSPTQEPNVGFSSYGEIE